MVRYIGEELEKRIAWLRKVFDLRKPEMAYLFGFLQADGHLGKLKGNKGRLSISLSIRDKEILDKIKNIIPVNSSVIRRTYDTNFKENYKLAVWTCCDQATRTVLNEFGLPYGKKSEIVKLPNVPFSEIDYFRGFFDGDGSLGFTNKGRPFISLVTSSTKMAVAFEKFCFNITGRHRKLTRNARDGVYNIMYGSDSAQEIIQIMYYRGCLSLNRKMKLAKKISKWSRAKFYMINKCIYKRWTQDQDDYILNHPIKRSIKKLDRTEQSIKMRLWRLNKGK